ncbi:MAG: hypothetical protein AABZ53_04075 [Planctomycetota bacterium]
MTPPRRASTSPTTPTSASAKAESADSSLATIDAIDALMDRASQALVRTDYFEVEKLCTQAIRLARIAGDFDRLSRICLPLQESRRQRRHEAVDSEFRHLLDHIPSRREPLLPGLYLVQPPLIGLDARNIRLASEGARVPVVVVCREPMTRSGLWPVVAVASGGLIDTLTMRVRVPPPPGVEPAADSPTKDHATQPPPPEWFLAANEALGDWAIASIEPETHPWYRVDCLLEALDALPDHEKLQQRLGDACRAASGTLPPLTPRRSSRHNDPFSF